MFVSWLGGASSRAPPWEVTSCLEPWQGRCESKFDRASALAAEACRLAQWLPASVSKPAHRSARFPDILQYPSVSRRAFEELS